MSNPASVTDAALPVLPGSDTRDTDPVSTPSSPPKTFTVETVFIKYKGDKSKVIFPSHVAEGSELEFTLVTYTNEGPYVWGNGPTEDVAASFRLSGVTPPKSAKYTTSDWPPAEAAASAPPDRPITVATTTSDSSTEAAATAPPCWTITVATWTGAAAKITQAGESIFLDNAARQTEGRSRFPDNTNTDSSDSQGRRYHLTRVYCKELIKPKPLDPSGLMFLGTLPVGGKVNIGESNYTYEGFTPEGMMVLHHAGGYTSHPPSRNMIANMLSHSAAAPTLPRAAPALRILSKKDVVVGKVISRLHSSTIRGKPIYKLLHYLHIKNQRMTPIYVVGGAVRDAFKGHEINDIDLAIGATWKTLIKDIKEFFGVAGSPLSDSIFVTDGKTREFGMVKIRPEGDEQEGLDIGVLKSMPWPSDLVKKTGERDERYIYGKSLERDAWQRDYTLNALYVDVFSCTLVDPLGRAWSDLEEGKICPAVPDNENGNALLKKDVGGRLRLWKLLRKGCRVGVTESENGRSDHERAVQILHMLVDEVGKHIKTATATDAGETAVEEAEEWVTKLAKKLFDNKEQFSDRAQTYWGKIEQLPNADAKKLGSEFWSYVRRLAEAVCKPECKVCGSFTADDEEQLFVWSVLKCLAALKFE